MLQPAAALHASARRQAKIVVALYDDPQTGYPPKYVRDSIPDIPFTTPVQGHGFTPGQLLGCVSGELGLRNVS